MNAFEYLSAESLESFLAQVRPDEIPCDSENRQVIPVDFSPEVVFEVSLDRL
jgi:hypothetical protein